MGNDDHKVYALKPNGALRWSYETEDSVDSSLAISADSTVYIRNDDGKLYAFKSSVSKKGSGRSSSEYIGIGWPGRIWPVNIIWPWRINTGWPISAVWPGNIGSSWLVNAWPGNNNWPSGINSNWLFINAGWQENISTVLPSSTVLPAGIGAGFPVSIGW